MACLLAAAIIAAAPGGAAAQESYKIGFVDSQKVMRDSRAAQQARIALEAEFKKREQEITGAPAAVQQRRNVLVEEMTLRRDDALKQLVDKANAAIRRIAQEEKFDAVFLEAAYASPGIDLTAKVIKALDSGR